MTDEGFRIRTECATPMFPPDSCVGADACTSPDTFLSYRTSRFCVDRRLRREDGWNPRTGDAFALPPAVVAPDAQRAGRDDATHRQCHTGAAAVSAVPPLPMPVVRLRAEDDEGDVEYKWRLTDVTPQRFEHLVTQMQFRVREGHGQCLYEIGVRDDGRMEGLPDGAFEASVATIHRMAKALGFACQEVRRVQIRVGDGAPASSTHHHCAELLVSRHHAEVGAPESSVAFCGTTGCGKSTLMGVLFSENLDDGNGTMSQLLFNHKHEVDSGRTSSLSTRIWSVSCGLSASSQSSEEDVCAAHGSANQTPAPPNTSSLGSLSDAVNSSADAECAGDCNQCQSDELAARVQPEAFSPPLRYISLLDLGGDITKTSLFGLMSRQPDLVCICLQAGCESIASAILCAKACRAMDKALAIVVTQIDLLEDFELDGFLVDLSSQLEAALGCECHVVEHADSTLFEATGSFDGINDGAAVASRVSPSRLPVFCLSSVSGAGLDVFRDCLSHLPTRTHHGLQETASAALATAASPFEVWLDRRAFNVEGTGPVVSGVVTRGPVAVGTHCFIGPDKVGEFHKVRLCGIHVNGVHVNEARRGDEATFALSAVPRQVELAAKGKVLSHAPLGTVHGTMRLCVEVIAQELKVGAQPVLYARNARQAINVVSVSPSTTHATTAPAEPVRSAARQPKSMSVVVDCAFLYRAEILHVGTPVLLHWAPHGLAVGRVVAI